jgi:phospholipid transport system transporter-binding protein
MTTATISGDNTTWHLQGELTFTTVSDVLAMVKQRQQQSGFPQVIDLSQVKHTDSAGVALLLEILRLSQDKPPVFQQIPEQMRNIAQVSGVDGFLSGV